VIEWRRARDAGVLAGPPRPRGRPAGDPRDAQIARLQKQTARLEQAVTGGQLTGIREEFVALKVLDLVRRQLRLGATASPAFVPPLLRQKISSPDVRPGCHEVPERSMTGQPEVQEGRTAALA
jgi:hypothetical protein